MVFGGIVVNSIYWIVNFFVKGVLNLGIFRFNFFSMVVSIVYVQFNQGLLSLFDLVSCFGIYNMCGKFLYNFVLGKISNFCVVVVQLVFEV